MLYWSIFWLTVVNLASLTDSTENISINWIETKSCNLKRNDTFKLTGLFSHGGTMRNNPIIWINQISKSNKKDDHTICAIHQDRCGTLFLNFWRCDCLRFDRNANIFFIELKINKQKDKLIQALYSDARVRNGAVDFRASTFSFDVADVQRLNCNVKLASTNNSNLLVAGIVWVILLGTLSYIGI